MSWITDKLLGYRQLLFGGNLLPQRGAINFVTGATVTDNPATGATDVSITSADVFLDATYLAVPDSIVKRSPGAGANFGGTCQFGSITCSGDVTSSGVMNCVILNAAESLTCGGILTAQVIDAGDIGVSGNVGVVGTLSCGDLQASSIYCPGDTIIGGSLSSTGNILTQGDALIQGAVLCSNYRPYSGGAMSFATPNVSGAVSSAITIKTGNVTSASSSVQHSGLLTLQGGTTVASGTGSWSSIVIQGGGGLGASSTGGDIYVTAGAATTGNQAGDVTISAGTGGKGGVLSLAGGTSIDSTLAGPVIIGGNNGNICLGGGSGGLSQGIGTIYIHDANTVPGSNPSGGGVLYVQAGALKYRGSSGTVTTIAPA